MTTLVDSIRQLNPKHYFKLDPQSNFFNYNGRTFEGAILDEVAGVVLESTLMTLDTVPSQIELYARSVVAVEKMSNALLVGSSSVKPYFLSHRNPVSQSTLSNDMSFHLNLEVDKGELTMFQISNPRAVAVYRNGDYLSDCTIVGNSVRFVDAILNYDTFVYEFVDTLTQNVLYTYTVVNGIGQPVSSAPVVDFVADDANTENLDGSIVIKNVYAVVQNSYTYLTKPSATTSSTSLGLAFEFEHFIDIISPLTKVDRSDIYTPVNSKVVTFGELCLGVTKHTTYCEITLTRLLSSGNFLLHHRIEYNKKYSVVVTVDTPSGGLPTVRMYVNGVLAEVGGVQGLTTSWDLLNTPCQIGTGYSSINNTLKLPSGFTRIQHLAVYEGVISLANIKKLHVARYNFDDYIAEYMSPKTNHILSLPTMTNKYYEKSRGTNTYDSFTSSGFTTSQYSGKYSVRTKGVRFTGQGSLNKTDNNITLSSDFTKIIYARLLSSDVTIVSQQANGGTFAGYTLKYSNGSIKLTYNKETIQAQMVIPLDVDVIIIIEKTTAQMLVKVYSNEGLILASATFSLTQNILSYQSNMYIMSTFNANETVDVVVYKIMMYQYIATEFLYTYQNTSHFKNSGKILLKNLPHVATLRVYDNENGELLDTIQTDVNGEYEFDDVYQRKLDVIVFGSLGHVGDISPIYNGI